MSGGPATLDPDRLDAFVAELEQAGFVAQDDDGRCFGGPLPQSLAPFTDAATMLIVIRDGWPYRQPNVIVPGIHWWHAAHEKPCLWQAGDNTKRWMTMRGILERLDEWAEQASAGFTSLDGAALDPHLYFEHHRPDLVGIDVAGLVGGLAQDGQHQPIHLDVGPQGMPVIVSGPAKGHGGLSGHWFYRSVIAAPPRSLADFEAALTDNQRQRLDKIIATRRAGLFVLIWPTTPRLLLAGALHWRVRRPAARGHLVSAYPARPSGPAPPCRA